ncbi:hypothetical protein RIR_e431_jg120.t1 [Rhizophagus irregularis DAOM 181602=DAOM 197198]|nr:hypothetical protein RIR_e431_jg120.t1 [Rhizophagus irregularis DAOM 181602=DAOM 197198]
MKLIFILTNQYFDNTMFSFVIFFYFINFFCLTFTKSITNIHRHIYISHSHSRAALCCEKETLWVTYRIL